MLQNSNKSLLGSFKIRGVTNQMEHIPDEVRNGTNQAVTLSAGNYGKAFAYCMSKKGLKGLVIMPHTAPDDRVNIIKVRHGRLIYASLQICHLLKKYLVCLAAFIEYIKLVS